jgi:hypothetical protein
MRSTLYPPIYPVYVVVDGSRMPPHWLHESVRPTSILAGIRNLPLISSERPHPFFGSSLVAFKARFSCRFSFSCSYFVFFFLGWSVGSSAAGADSFPLFSNILLNSASLYVLFRPKLVIRVMVAAKWSVPDNPSFLRDTQIVMGKQKSKQEKCPNLASVPNKDLMQRMSFLYQVAAHLSQQSCLFEENSDVKSLSKGSKKAKKRNGTPQDLAAFHVRSMKAIGTKSMVKMRVISLFSI